MSKLIQKIASWDNLLNAFYKAADGKWDWPAVIDFYNSLESNLARMQNEILSGTYHVRSYNCKVIHEKKKRLVMALPFYDRVIQWAIYAQIVDWLDKKMIYNSYGSRAKSDVKRGTLKAVEKLRSWCHICTCKNSEYRYLKLDISKFFYRIDHATLINIFKRYYKNDDEFIALLTGIITSDKYAFGLPRFKSIDDVNVDEMIFDKGMPVGNLLSQLFANVYLNELDQYCKHVLKIKYYIRYMDDIVILCDDLNKIHYYHDMIESYLSQKLKLDLNDKTCIGKVKAGITFLSRRVYPNHVRLCRSSAKRIKSKIIKACIQYANGEIDFDKAMQILKSYDGELKHVECDGLKRWISKNAILQRNKNPKDFKQKVRTKHEGIELSDHAQAYAAA